jgi:two-component system phosphate regulon sensor histidine kinase PhoR
MYTESEMVHLKIIDDGPGVPTAYKEKIFEKFVRVPQDNINNIKGYGLGLSYARFIIEAHHGHLKLEQKSGTGATFHLSLPVISNAYDLKNIIY